MPEVLAAIVGLLVVVFYLASPFFAIAAWRRSRRLEERLREFERRQSMPGPLPAIEDSPSAPPPYPAPELFDDAEFVPPRESDGSSSPTVPPLVVARDEMPHRPVWAPTAASRVGPSWRSGWAAFRSAWDERLGGSVLGKAGALLIVIGVALFVGWSMVHMGPAGRVAVALAVSAALLSTGIAFQRRPDDVSLAISLSAAGWGGLYVTAYAMHGLDAARVIDDPRAAFALLLAVAAGMIVHALRFGRPMLVAVAYAAAFAAIALGPGTTYAAVACVLLAATLLVVASREGWGVFGVVGLLCTYATLAFRFPPLEELFGGTVIPVGHVLIWACWLLFEAFDIVMVAMGRTRLDQSRTLVPLNLCGLLGVSLLQWPHGREGFDLFLAAAAGGYAVSSLCRIVARVRSPVAAAADPVNAALLGGYEPSLLIASVLWAVAIWLRFVEGWRLHFGLLLEAECLFLAGVLFGSRFLRILSAGFFAVLLVRFLAIDVPAGGETVYRSLAIASSTPSALLAAAVLFANRWGGSWAGLQPLLPAERIGTYAASALVSLVIASECLWRHVGLGPDMLGFLWLLQAWVLLQVGVRKESIDFYWQSCILGCVAIVPLVLANVMSLAIGDAAGRLPAWLWLMPSILLLHAIAWRLARPGTFTGQEPPAADVGGAALFAASLGTLALLWHALPAPLVALGWGGYAIVSFQLGVTMPHAGLRHQAELAVAFTVGRLFLANFTNAGMTGFLSHRLLTVAPVVCMLYGFATTLTGGRLLPMLDRAERTIGRVFLWAATAVLVVLLRFEMGRVLAVVSWAVLGVVLLVVGRRRSVGDLRWQSHAIAILTFARSLGTHFYVPEAPDGLLRPWVLGSVVVASLFACELGCPPPSASRHRPAGFAGLLAWLDDRGRTFYAFLGTVLLGILLAHEVPAGLLTAALGIAGGCLLVVGFLRPDRDLRACGLAVLGVCVLKLFLYDLRHLETPYRILSFLLLGGLLIAASWIYTRFKSRLRAVS